ncbi:conserved hypothetical protein [Candidatus Desulfosporosinus infrequens]|uniref:KOW domain-containing protein n=1 Tax=Candidatus Desulfosporosinus infrequens TaxID=2043169 RepID=A0A2U3LIR5_9FIRM|nr:conserved hypothetical protein [Candidatus Desulfosporosinus infrequens]
MLAQKLGFKVSLSHSHQYQFQVGDRVETYNHCKGTVVRVDIEEGGVFIVVRLDIPYGEFVYDPYELEIIR